VCCGPDSGLVEHDVQISLVPQVVKILPATRKRRTPVMILLLRLWQGEREPSNLLRDIGALTPFTLGGVA
jgi:hypothetical protein